MPNQALKLQFKELTKFLLRIALALAFTFLLVAQKSEAQVIAPSATEILYSYTAEFIAPAGYDSANLAHFHASHMFGIFGSPTLIESFNLDPNTVGGIGAPRSQMNIQILANVSAQGGLRKITYTNSGKILAQKNVARSLLRKGEITIPLPARLENFYNINCTDPHYQDIGDFWYFYDPFRVGCEYLSQAPAAQQVTFKIKPIIRQIPAGTKARLDLLRGNNGNGAKFSIYMVHGYAESQTSRIDDGRIEFQNFNESFKAQGFTETILNRTDARPYHLYKKQIVLSSGKVIEVEIKHLLVETEIDYKGITFAKFFKEAVEQADVIIYAGHSGLGANLDIAALEDKAGKFQFNSRKKQIFFFESCSSYSYYLETFSAEKTRAKIDIVTNGLSSYFETSNEVISNFLNILLDPTITDAAWIDILKSMEEPLQGGTYLLNVGGL